ncbi:hypothetical protein IMCC1989_1353 [gamma proteobacterium IMCC1989]|nr:hypothetical protein IMCC1989_1353 [gamma proteobacterium IMCC1989]
MEQFNTKAFNLLGYLFIFFGVVGLLSGDVSQAFILLCVGVLFSPKVKDWVYKKSYIKITIVNGLCFAFFGLIAVNAITIHFSSVNDQGGAPVVASPALAFSILIPAYTIILETKTQDPNHHFEWTADILIPSFSLNTPIKQRCEVAHIIKKQQQFDSVSLCSSEGGCRVPYSASFKRENPQLVVDYLGVLDEKGYFSDDSFQSVASDCTEFSAVTNVESLFPAAVETPSIDAFISENKQFGNIILREKLSDWMRGERYRINTYYEKDGLHALRFIFYLENGEVVTVYQDIPHDGGTKRTEIYRKSSE